MCSARSCPVLPVTSWAAAGRPDSRPLLSVAPSDSSSAFSASSSCSGHPWGSSGSPSSRPFHRLAAVAGALIVVTRRRDDRRLPPDDQLADRRTVVRRGPDPPRGRCRGRLDALHRADARGDPHAGRIGSDRGRGDAPSSSPTHSAWPCRSCWSWSPTPDSGASPAGSPPIAEGSRSGQESSSPAWASSSSPGSSRALPDCSPSVSSSASPPSHVAGRDRRRGHAPQQRCRPGRQARSGQGLAWLSRGAGRAAS